VPDLRLADAVRRLIAQAVGSQAPPEELEATVAELEAIAERLEAAPRRPDKVPTLPDLRELKTAFAADPIVGARNPLAPPVDAWIEGHEVHARATFGRQYEGPPGYVHGGVIAGVFDMICGLANLASGNHGMTGTLTIRYLRPTPLHTEILMEASAVGREGRKNFVSARFLNGTKVTAEADGLFIELGERHAQEYFTRAADLA
jgi:acyl-coenzyme A thioesterase PaaI-like protein